MNKFNVNVAWGIGVTTVTNVHSIIDGNLRLTTLVPSSSVTHG
jgi:hypothetical protein